MFVPDKHSVVFPPDFLKRIANRVQKILIRRQDEAIEIELNHGHRAVQRSDLICVIFVHSFALGSRQYD